MAHLVVPNEDLEWLRAKGGGLKWWLRELSLRLFLRRKIISVTRDREESGV